MTLQTVDVSSVASWEASFVEERLGPSPKWDGYSDIEDQEVAQRVYGNVGFIHAQSAEVGRGVIAIGQKLQAIKADLPHGQFVDCVGTEFGWSRQWAQQLMLVADRFSNVNSSCHLPSSAKVLALLAAANADDATVEQAAQEHWTVKQTRQNLGGEKQRERTLIDDALKVLRFSDEARRLAASVQYVNDRQLMDELGVDKVPTDKRHITPAATFVKDKEGWIKFPLLQAVDAVALPPRTQEDLFTDKAPAEEVIPVAKAAARMGFATRHQLSCLLAPSSIAKKGNPRRNGWEAMPSSKHAHCVVRRVD